MFQDSTIGKIIIWLIVIFTLYYNFLRPNKKDKMAIPAKPSPEEEASARRHKEISEARQKTEALARRGAIFEITTASSINGYHIKELGWVQYNGDERSLAEKNLRNIAAERFASANALTKLSYTLKDERYQAGIGPQGNPHYRNRKIKTWEAVACEAIPIKQVDQSPNRWNERVAVVDGSNVAHWGHSCDGSISVVRAILDLLVKQGVRPILVFDANIGFKVYGRHIDEKDLKKDLGEDILIEIVPSGTVADRRIIEIAEKEKAIIVSNDFFRDSLRARTIPKRRGFFVPRYNHAELLESRP